MIGILKRLFGGDEDEATPEAGSSVAAESATKPEPSGEPEPVAFVDYVVRALVDAPESVNLDTVEAENSTTINITCAKSDIGKVIGRRGRTIGAIRALTNGAAGRKGHKINVEVLD